MKGFIRLIQDLDLMRMVVGICIIIDGYPLIFFFRETLRLAPGSTAFTAAALAGGLVLMIPFTVLRRLYRPNITMFWIGISFIFLCIFYMFFYNGEPGFKDYDKDMIYFTYILVFLFLLINIPNDIIRVFIPVVILFTLVSNLGLIYSLLTNPTWAVGQRATITLGDNDDGTGNPHVFARNAYMGLVACVIWLVRPKTNTLFRLVCFFAGAVNVAVLILTLARSAVLAVIIAFCLFMYFNVRPAQIRSAVRGLFRPVPILIILIGLAGINFFFQKYYSAYSILYGYLVAFIERNMENVYALLGLKASGTGFRAVLDDSAANRTVSATFFRNALVGHLHMLLLGYGYKYSYLDVPILEAFISLGVAGFLLFGGINLLSFYYSLRAMRLNPNPLNTFMAYFYIYIFVIVCSGGRPYEITFWFPLSLMIRFMGIEHLFPAYLQDNPPVASSGALAPATTQVA